MDSPVGGPAEPEAPPESPISTAQGRGNSFFRAEPRSRAGRGSAQMESEIEGCHRRGATTVFWYGDLPDESSVIGSKILPKKLEAYSVTLDQVPSEQLEFSGDLCYISSVNEFSMYTCKFKLKFRNYPCKIVKDYEYELVCEVAVRDKKRVQHVHLFSDKKSRKHNEIHFDETFFYANYGEVILHMCFALSRQKRGCYGLLDGETAKNVCALLLKNEFKPDVSLFAGELAYPAHRCVLAMRSEVFKAMFTHDMLENENGILKIDDFDPEVVEQMLEYVYTGKARRLPQIAMELFEIAHKYELYDLEAQCEEYLLFNISNKNVTRLFDFAVLYELDSLREGSIVYMKEREEELVLETTYNEYLVRNLTLDNLVRILKLSMKYDLKRVKAAAFEFIKNHEETVEDERFLDLFDSHPALMREVYIFLYKKM